ncbi:MAG TPA: HIT family protein [Candidatus Kapabacteria bacterium]|nr:HIT family protein [Candidatus Kapabacteria bacterium]
MDDCIFCRIAAKQEPAWVVYEDESHIAFLTPFPNTPGFTVLAPKEHRSSDVLGLEEKEYLQMMKTAKKLAAILNEKLHTKRTGLIIEGMGVDHAHVKLVPMHGISVGDWKPILSGHSEFSNTYNGYLTTHDGPRMNDAELDAIKNKMLA